LNDEEEQQDDEEHFVPNAREQVIQQPGIYILFAILWVNLTAF